jgi:hypothetical protein
LVSILIVLTVLSCGRCDELNVRFCPYNVNDAIEMALIRSLGEATTERIKVKVKEVDSRYIGITMYALQKL